MRIRFVRLDVDLCEIVVTGRKGHDVRLPAAPVRGGLPHDLVHAAVEESLRITDGFWGAVAAGATYDGFEPLEPRRHRGSGAKVLRRRGDRVMAGELKVNYAYRLWRGLPRTGTGPSPLSPEEILTTNAAIDAVETRWRNTPKGSALEWTWHL